MPCLVKRSVRHGDGCESHKAVDCRNNDDNSRVSMEKKVRRLQRYVSLRSHLYGFDFVIKKLNISTIMRRKSKIAFIEPLLASAMVIERHIDSCIREAGQYGISQFKILLSIQRLAGNSKKGLGIKGRCCQSVIAQHLGVSEAAVSRQISVMASDRLLTRTHDPDEKRRVVLGLTAKGKGFLSKTMRMVDKELARIFRPISKTSRNQLASHLNKTLESLSRNTDHYQVVKHDN